MLEFFLFLIGGLAYSLYFDLNPLETVLVAVVATVVLRGGLNRWAPDFGMRGAWRTWIRLAQHKKLAVLAVFLFALAIRAALLPLLPVPKPMIPDEFGHLLIADTLTHGRLTNPTHPMWPHFESLHIFHHPSYDADFFPGQGAILALGKLAGHPWIAVWLLSAAMCAALCWMLQAWVPPQWALFGALLAVFRFGVASYWINSYYGGCLAATGGALVLGSYPRLLRKPSFGTSLLFGLGLVAIGYSRPFEGLAVAIPAVAVAGFAVVKKRIPFWVCIPVSALALAGVAGLLIYSKGVTGDPLRTPYAVNQATYGWPMTLPWSHPWEPRFRHIELRRYWDYEKDTFENNRSLLGSIKNSTVKGQVVWRFYFGPALTIPLLLLPRVWRNRRIRLLLLAGGLSIVGRINGYRYHAPLCRGRHCLFFGGADGLFQAALPAPSRCSAGGRRARHHAADPGGSHRPGTVSPALHPESEFFLLVLRHAWKSKQGAHCRLAGKERRKASGDRKAQVRSAEPVSVDLQRRRYRRFAGGVGAGYGGGSKSAAARLFPGSQGLAGRSEHEPAAVRTVFGYGRERAGSNRC